MKDFTEAVNWPWLTCCSGWRSLVCLLDNANHAILKGYRIRALCVFHDWCIGLTWKEARSGVKKDFTERHKAAGCMTNQPGPSIDWDRPVASTWVCTRDECQEKARFWVQGITGESAVFVPFEEKS